MVFAFKPDGLGSTSWNLLLLSSHKRTKRIVSWLRVSGKVNRKVVELMDDFVFDLLLG